MKYSLDTSAILDAWRKYYPPDVFPLIWKKLDGLISQKVLIATEEVLVELERKDDQVYQWAKEREYMFYPLDNQIQLVVSAILQDHRKLIDERKNRSGADPFVIALAKIENCAVITGERPSNSLNRPHIPDVCTVLGIRWVNMLQLFRDQQWIFS